MGSLGVLSVLILHFLDGFCSRGTRLLGFQSAKAWIEEKQRRRCGGAAHYNGSDVTGV